MSEENTNPAEEGAREWVTPYDAQTQVDLREAVIETIKTCYDPEIPVDIYELGLIYSVELDAEGVCKVDMTLTSPACPVAGTLPPEVEGKIAAMPGVSKATVEVVWDPPWTQDRMTEAAQLQLGFI